MSNILKTISLDGFSKNVLQYQAGEGITITTDQQDSNKRIISAIGADLSNYYTKNETYSKTEVDNLISAIDEFKVELVNELPATGEEKTIYLVPKSGSQTSNVKDEYLWINGAWEKIGDTEVDLTNYYTKSETDALLDEKQDALTAGENIQIAQDGTISATDTTYENATQSDAGLMSAADKTKLDGIEAGAEANVQSDWNQTDNTADDFIKNKPGNATQSASGLMSNTDKTKLDGIETGAEANVQSDWNQTDTTADDYIKNKPDLSNYLTCADLADCQTIQDMQDDIDSKQDALTKASILALLGYEEVELSMTDTDGNTITKTILAMQEPEPQYETLLDEWIEDSDDYELCGSSIPAEWTEIINDTNVGDTFRITSSYDGVDFNEEIVVASASDVQSHSAVVVIDTSAETHVSFNCYGTHEGSTYGAKKYYTLNKGTGCIVTSTDGFAYLKVEKQV